MCTHKYKVLVFCFWDRILLCSSRWSDSYTAQLYLKLVILLSPASQVLGLQVCDTMSGPNRICFLEVLAVWIQGPCLLVSHSITWALSLCRFASIIFQIGSPVIACAGLDCSPPTPCLLCSWDHRHMPSCPAYWLKWDLPTLASNHNSFNLCFLRTTGISSRADQTTDCWPT
jgi:hypothetical protein